MKPTEMKSGREENTIATLVSNAFQAVTRQQWPQAEQLCQAALAQDPVQPDALHLMALTLKKSGRLTESLPYYQLIVERYPEAAFLPVVLGNYANALREGKDFSKARTCLERALAINPNDAGALNNLGLIQQDLGDVPAASASFSRAVELNPDLADAWNHYGGALQCLGKPYEALDAFRRAIALKPDSAEAHYNLGNLLADSGYVNESIQHYRSALAAKPDYIEVIINWLRQLQNACDWADLSVLSQRLKDWVRERRDGRVFPFAFVGIDTHAQEQRECAQQWAEHNYLPIVADSGQPPFEFSRQERPRLRIGYLSSDFHNHATAYLLAEVIELHDRSQFEIIAYSAGPDDGKEMRQRLLRSFDRFVDIQAMSHLEAARTIHADGIDILVDLKGYTRDTRSVILAFRPAPVQVNYLGYPGTLGAPIADYILTDRYVTPQEFASDFVEHLAYLPDCYQPNDRHRKIADPVNRAQLGLPGNTVVFCCFNHTYKITPVMFDLWCRLLKAVPDSVLWLLKSNPLAEQNLAREAEHRGVAASRLHFAPQLPLADHLARIRCADIFLDTFPVNAHTTASDALWAGIPVVTLSGRTFISRVAGSLLTAAGMPELIASTTDEYFNIAQTLAGAPVRLQEYKERLENQRHQIPLFDAERYTKALERRYCQMWQNWIAGRTVSLTD